MYFFLFYRERWLTDSLDQLCRTKSSHPFLAGLTPHAITPTGHVSVKPTMQIVDDTLSNIYACGDVEDTGTLNPNSRAAMQQAKIAADSLVLVARGNSRYNYKHHWAESVIKLTLELVWFYFYLCYL